MSGNRAGNTINLITGVGITSTNFLAERVLFFYITSTVSAETIFLSIDGLTQKRLVRITEAGVINPATLVRAGKIYGVTWVNSTNEHQLLSFSD